MLEGREELLHLKELLQLEKGDDLRRYQADLKDLTLAQRRAKGIAWYPLEVKETGYGLGEYPYIILERNSHKEVPHHFHAGKLISLFTNNDDYKGEETKGTVNYVDKDRIKVVLYADELPEWVEDGKIGINLMYDEYSYRVMENALDKVIKAEGGRLAQLTDVLLGLRKPQFDRLRVPLTTVGLNASQQNAVEKIVTAEDVALVHGPPGTGKTTTLVQVVKEIAKEEKNVLVCAPSNAAADLLTERLAMAGLKVVRIGNLSRIDDTILKHTLEHLMDAHTDMKDIRQYRKQAAEYRRMAGKYKRHFGREERQQRDALYKEAKEVGKTAARLEDTIVSSLLDQADAITCTLAGSMNHYLEGRKFKTVIIDEAAQALEPATWIPITLGEKIVLAGDPFQLPPTVKSQAAQDKGLTKTLLEKCMQRIPDASLLEVQYRMNRIIMGFSNQWFYEGKLQAHASVIDTVLSGEEEQGSLEFIDTAGCGFDEQEEATSRSLYNPGEAETLAKRLERLVSTLPAGESFSIGIISPYREQVIWLSDHIKTEDYPQFDISIDTIDSFQGQERDIILLSLVRSNEKNEIGFLSDYRRMNVAITRARKKLVVIGDSGTLSSSKFYEAFIKYAEDNGTYLSAWEFM